MGLDVIESGFDALLGRGKGIRVATEASDISLPLSLRCGQKDKCISTLRIARRARWTAVDTCRNGCVNKFAVVVPIFLHDGMPIDVAYLAWCTRHGHAKTSCHLTCRILGTGSRMSGRSIAPIVQPQA